MFEGQGGLGALQDFVPRPAPKNLVELRPAKQSSYPPEYNFGGEAGGGLRPPPPGTKSELCSRSPEGGCWGKRKTGRLEALQDFVPPPANSCTFNFLLPVPLLYSVILWVETSLGRPSPSRPPRRRTGSFKNEVLRSLWTICTKTLLCFQEIFAL